MDPGVEQRQRERTARVRSERDPEAARSALEEVRTVAGSDANLLPPMREALRRSAAPSARFAASCASFGVHMTPSMRSSTRLAIAAAAFVALAVPLAALAMARDDVATTAAPSFTRDVAPVIAEKCAGCHRPGGIAPFALVTAKQISQSSPRSPARWRRG